MKAKCRGEITFFDYCPYGIIFGMETFLTCRLQLKIEMILTFPHGNNITLFLNLFYLTSIKTKSLSKQLVVRWCFIMKEILDFEMVTKKTNYSKLTLMRSFGELFKVFCCLPYNHLIAKLHVYGVELLPLRLLYICIV